MTHLWIRSEQRVDERRVGLTPEGAAHLIRKGFTITVEESKTRILPISSYRKAGCRIAQENSWPSAPHNAYIFGLKELPDDETPLHHRHIMFGHAFKGQKSGKNLLKRFKSYKGTLYDIEYLVDNFEKRVAAFGYWAGFVGAALSLKAWLFQKKGFECSPVEVYENKNNLINELSNKITRLTQKAPSVIIIGALGRVGTGACNLCEALELKVTRWDLKETAAGGPFPEILDHDIFLNCILASDNTSILLSNNDIEKPRRLSVIGDIACDPESPFNPLPIYNNATNWEEPSRKILSKPVLEIMAIDNLPSILPKESSIDFASQLLPYLEVLDSLEYNVWNRAESIFREKLVGV